MWKFENQILSFFLAICCVHQCLTHGSTFQNATLFCKTFTSARQSLSINYDELSKNANNSCHNNAYKVAYVTGTVRTIYENTVTDLQNLNGLNFTQVGLEEIQIGAFTNFPKLETLTLNSNNVKEIRSGVFQNLPLVDLLLNNNSISTLEERAFHNLASLRMLSLEKNSLKKIQKRVFDNIALWVLNLRHNEIDEIEAGAFDAVHPESHKWNILIYLSDNNLKEINPEVFNIEHLVTLNLDKNSISKIRPGDLANLPNLRDLHLSRNRLKLIPNDVFKGSTIENLDISHNQISEIESQAFDDMEYLLKLNMGNNKLKIWDGNWFSGSWSSGFHTFRKLYAGYNNIEEIPGNAFQNFGGNYFIVDLKWNKIRGIADGAFNGVTGLHLLDLSHNEISKWDENLLRQVKVIGTVNLSGNKFKCADISANYAVVPRARRVILQDCVQFDEN
ncbi:hypothetical protein Zmor_018881 [Zophobas morio]|uniref:Uncharacterized protein n=1 Tax=Zophobas morio TaxID=2755281 RepID=A0AA38MEE9_9CUCU|nr:hypothetical protein Zmor_018881 [Zophobas morio]